MNITATNIHLLLNDSIQLLKKSDQKKLYEHLGTVFEPMLLGVMESAQKILAIKNIKKIGLVSGHKYPDIVICLNSKTKSETGVKNTAKIRIEVKTSKNTSWPTLGGSVFESKRVKGVDTVFIFFTNFSNPNEPLFRYKNMDDCISDVLITQKPRYAVDMDMLEIFFTQAGVTYQEIRDSDKPSGLIKIHLKERAGQGADLWWVDEREIDNLDRLGPQAIRFFKSSKSSEKEKLINKIYILFPEVISRKSKNKYQKATLFLVTKRGVIHTALRDIFSVGGEYIFENCCVSQCFRRLLEKDSLQALINQIKETPLILFEEFGWNLKKRIIK